MDRVRTKEEIDILINQRKAAIEKVKYCLDNIDNAAAGIEVFVGEKNTPFKFYFTTDELREFLNKELDSHNSHIEQVRRYYSPVFAL